MIMNIKENAMRSQVLPRNSIVYKSKNQLLLGHQELPKMTFQSILWFLPLLFFSGVFSGIAIMLALTR